MPPFDRTKPLPLAVCLAGAFAAMAYTTTELCHLPAQDSGIKSQPHALGPDRPEAPESTDELKLIQASGQGGGTASAMPPRSQYPLAALQAWWSPTTEYPVQRPPLALLVAAGAV
jgi:hypothetical protein